MLYFSEWLTSNKLNRDVLNQITFLLDKHAIKYTLLPNTKDIWARDYMPIQVNHQNFVEYIYQPDYLIDEPNFITKTNEVCKSIGIETVKTKLILDGGNVVKYQNKAILTDKIFLENAFQFTEQEVMEELKKAFQLEYVFIIPWDTSEPYGHADGMVRFVDENTILTHGFYRTYPTKFQAKIYEALKTLNIIELNFEVKSPDENFNWGYINFLQTPEIILVPVFGIEEDKQALEQIGKAFTRYAASKMIYPINMKSFVKKGGGALNCISWEVESGN
jgi:agmatine deiminase